MDEEDFKRLYQALRDPVFTFACRRLSLDQAKDIVGETFEVVWRKRDEAPADRDQWPAWCVGIAKNKVLQEWQRRARKHHDNRFLADHRPYTITTGVDVADVVADTIAGRWIWSQLTENEQMLASIAFFPELSVQDAATILGITGTAYTTRLSRLRRRIEALRQQSENVDTHSDPTHLRGSS